MQSPFLWIAEEEGAKSRIKHLIPVFERSKFGLSSLRRKRLAEMRSTVSEAFLFFLLRSLSKALLLHRIEESMLAAFGEVLSKPWIRTYPRHAIQWRCKRFTQKVDRSQHQKRGIVLELPEPCRAYMQHFTLYGKARNYAAFHEKSRTGDRGVTRLTSSHWHLK